MNFFDIIKSNDDLSPCLSVVMPAFNEEATVEVIVPFVLTQRPVQELIVVDDGSSDQTWPKLQQLARTDARLKVFRHQTNQGKGAALRSGLAKTTSPIVVIQDADLEYDPREYYL